MKSVCMLLVASGFSVAVLAAPDTRTAGAAVLVMPLSALADDCDIRCTEPPDCDPGEHDAWEGSPVNAMRNGGVHLDPVCYPGTCDTKHGPMCGPPDFANSEFEELRRRLARNDAAGAATLVLAHGREVVVNVERSAVQILDCTGGVVAHLPVSTDLAASLAHASRSETPGPLGE